MRRREVEVCQDVRLGLLEDLSPSPFRHHLYCESAPPSTRPNIACSAPPLNASRASPLRSGCHAVQRTRRFHMARRIRAREVLRLRSVNGLSQNAIAHTAHVSKHSVQDVLEAARERGVSWEDVEGMSEEAAYALLFPGRGDAGPAYADPDWARVHRELAKTGVMLHPVQEEGLAPRGSATECMPTPSWTGSCTTRSGSTWARQTCGSAADRPLAIKKHRGQCRPRCPSAISAVPFRDIRQCSSEQILKLLLQAQTVAWLESHYLTDLIVMRAV